MDRILASTVGLLMLGTSLVTSLVIARDAGAADAKTEASYVVAQENKAFSTDHLVVKAGETVRFPNRDPFYHNVFSLSSGATFDLGSYPKGEEREVTFDKPGMIEVECAIHPSMQMTIEVRE